ncbi:MAG: D-alanyl-D-alanine carboxypeptidase, partial [Proteobacteria bacterium]|nr:D-alanyl-D-alanine carboxypeptidase [Pseudomonadota bacterium]
MRVDGRDRFLRLAAACVCAAGISVLSASPGLAKYASVIMDAETGRVVHAVNANTRNYPASLTKMMTLYMVFEALEDGRLSMDQRLKVSARSARQPSSRLGLRKGQTITVKQAILAMVTKSANDVAATVAEALSGSERNFA